MVNKKPMERQESERTKRNRILQAIISMLMKILCQSKKQKPSKEGLGTEKGFKRSDIID